MPTTTLRINLRLCRISPTDSDYVDDRLLAHDLSVSEVSYAANPEIGTRIFQYVLKSFMSQPQGDTVL